MHSINNPSVSNKSNFKEIKESLYHGHCNSYFFMCLLKRIYIQNTDSVREYSGCATLYNAQLRARVVNLKGTVWLSGEIFI